MARSPWEPRVDRGLRPPLQIARAAPDPPDNDLAPLIPHGRCATPITKNGARVAVDPIPAELVSYYGTSFPLGGMVYLRLRPGEERRLGLAVDRP